MTQSQRTLLVATLLENDHEFKKLHQEHQVLEEQLAGFNGRVKLTPEDEMKRKNIQKRKLQQKDRMEEILRRAQDSGVGVAFA